MNDMNYVVAQCAEEFVETLPDNSVHLLAIDPPYFHIVDEVWDHHWSDTMEYARWLFNILRSFYPKLTHDASVVFFGAIGKHGERPLFEVMKLMDGPDSPYFYRNLITWQKRRAYGKSHDYLFCREEIAWYSCASARTVVRFNIPLTSEKRGYAGFNPKYPAKSEYKRVSNVWTDIPELMRPERPCQKPVALMRRIVETHSNQGDLVVDCFAGYGTTGLACAETGRLFRGCEGVSRDARVADARIRDAFNISRMQR
jgi:adenine-specific DNA-methyltransferase